MTPRLIWLPTHANELRHLSAQCRVLWVAAERGGTLTRDGRVAVLPDPVSITEALKDYDAGPGARSGVAAARWQLWERGRMGASG
jgi:hypothetical protein